MRVLDVGSGAGDVAFLAAELVGPSGEVVGTDRVATALETARQRAKDRTMSNVTFAEGDPAEMVFAAPFDAVVGRYVLMYQPDPAATLRKLASHVRPAGIVVFHEPYRDGVRSFPPVAAYDQGWELVDETFRRSGADPLMGIKLHATFVAAGLAPPTMRMEAVIAGGATNRTAEYHFHTGRPLARMLGYDPAIVDALPDRAVESFAGVGNPFSLRTISSGERVVDVGSGAGFDSFVAASFVGGLGRVVGIDMTPEMLDKSRATAEQLGCTHVEFREGLAEAMPVDDGWADVVISNGVINLCADKRVGLRRDPPSVAAGRRVAVRRHRQRPSGPARSIA